MNFSIKKYIKTPFFLLFISTLWTQFSDIDVELDLRRLSEGNRQLVEPLKEEIYNYYLNTSFSTDVNDLEMSLNIRLVVESITRGGSQTTINAKAIFTNNMDQYFYAKSIQFPYERNKKLVYNNATIFQPLNSFLDYYAFMFIGTEMDTYEYMGGTKYYNKAIELSSLGKNSDWNSGWDDRWKKGRKIRSNEYLRSIRFNFFLAIDELSAEKVDTMIIRNSMKIFYEDLITLDKKIGTDKKTLNFLNAYHKKIAELLYALQMEETIKFLILYDHDNKEVYESYLSQ